MKSKKPLDEMLTHEEVVNILRGQVDFDRNRSDIARDLGMSRSYLWEVMNGKKKIGFEFADALGLEIVFRRTKNAKV